MISTHNRQTRITAETLNAIKVFQGLVNKDRSEISNLCHGYECDEGNVIVSHKDTHKDVYFIISGKVRISIYSKTGREISFRDQSAGEMFGELSSIDDQPRSAHVVALTDTRIIKINQDKFRKILNEYPSVSDFIFKHMAQLIRSLSERVIEFSSLSVNNRVHAELLRLAKKSNIDNNQVLIRPAPKHAEIASRISTHREAVTRVLKKLADDMLIEKKTSAILVKDVSKLEQMVNDVMV